MFRAWVMFWASVLRRRRRPCASVHVIHKPAGRRACRYHLAAIFSLPLHLSPFLFSGHLLLHPFRFCPLRVSPLFPAFFPPPELCIALCGLAAVRRAKYL